MKKLIITVMLAGSLGLYSLYLKRGVGNDDVHVVAPPSLASTVPSTTDTSSSNSSSDTTGSTPPASPSPTPTPTPTPKPTPTPTPTPVPVHKSGLADGTFTGSVEDAYYGYIQVRATIQNGKITDVTFLQAPNDRRESQAINGQADPWLSQEAIQAQSANVDIISGATDSSLAFIKSLGTALSKAKA